MKKDLKQNFVKQLKDVIELYENSKIDSNRVASNIIVRAQAVVNRIAGKNSDYYKKIENIINQYDQWADRYTGKIQAVMGAVDGLLLDLESDSLKSLTELIHDDLFSDYLEMAESLLEDSFKDASAVIAGSTLEEHLRKLSEKNNINTKIISSSKEKPKKTSQLNQELYKNEILGKGEMMQITAWLDIRNNAAHGNYGEYDNNIVELMIKGIRSLISNYPA